MTPHIESKKEDIAEIVIMPGDPLRAKYIATNYLKDYKLVNTVRNMSAYTGYFNNKRVTIFPSGMGIPSMGIYAYELIKFYNVKKIIRVGTCGSNNINIKLNDVILSERSESLSYFPYQLDDKIIDNISSSKKLNKIIINKAKELGINLLKGKTITTDVFDVYVDDKETFEKKYSNDALACEMEAFALFFLADKFNIDASCILTVVDSKYDKNIISSKDREKSLDKMIVLALNSIIEEE